MPDTAADLTLTSEAEALYRLMPARELETLRQAFRIDRDRHKAWRHSSTTYAFCQGRIDLINRILFERRPRRGAV